jgi:protein TIF31
MFFLQPEDFEKGAMEDVEKAEKAEDDESSKDQQDVVFIQDVGFTVKVVAPNVEAFDIQV